MIIFIVGLPGHGKTSWLQWKIEDTYHTRRHELWRLCCKELDKQNSEREVPFDYPDKDSPPIYAPIDMGSRFRVKRYEYFEPFIINPYLLSASNKGIPTQHFLPYAQIFIPEAQKYFSSKQHQNLNAGVHRFFETHRHNHYDIYLDSQVGGFVDARIRKLVDKVIEVHHQTHIYDGMGGIVHTTWHCREFECLQDYDEYFNNHGVMNYTETTYEYDGDIRKNYNGHGSQGELIPPEGQQYSMLKPLSREEIRALPKEQAIFYSIVEPEGYRGKITQKNS